MPVSLSKGVEVQPTYRLSLVALRQPMMLLTKRDWVGAEHLRVDGSLDPGIVVAVNHVSHFDPLCISHFLYDNGRLPRFLAKQEMFDVPIVGSIVKGAGQIPVYRGTSDAKLALSAAVDAVRGGECVVVYPEGTITKDPQMWPMAGKTGAVRIALESGAPLIPVAQWGPQEVMPPYSKKLRLLPPKTMHVWAGDPVNLDLLRGREIDEAALDEATRRLMTAITNLLEQIRGESAPATVYDPDIASANNDETMSP